MASPKKPLAKSEKKAGVPIEDKPPPRRAASPNAQKATVALKAFIHRLETLRLYSVKIRQAKANERLAPKA